MAETLLGRLATAALKALVYALLRTKPPEGRRASPVEHGVGAYTRKHSSGKTVEVRAYQRGGR
jgi:hypothetical protein